MTKTKQKLVIAPQKGKQELAFNLDVDVLIYGGAAGSGKSRLLLMKPLQYIKDSDFQAIFFRQTNTALENPGSLWPEGKKLYREFPGTTFRDKGHKVTFKSGAGVSMSYLEYDKDCQSHQGAQYSMVGFDELTHFTAYQFVYLISRLRSDSDKSSFLMATCNPSNDSWVLEWVEWYLYPRGTVLFDEDAGEEIDVGGRPDPEKVGKIRYFVINENSPVFADTPEELKENHPDLCRDWDPVNKTWRDIPPKSFAFIGGTVYDNPALLEKEPGYLASLKAQTRVERERLLHGNWYAVAEGTENFKREWLNKVPDDPGDCVWVRAWDKAGSIPNEVYKYPDYTACIKIGKSKSTGKYYIRGDFHPENKCELKTQEIYGKFQKLPGERDATILKQAEYDGEDVIVVLSQDVGQAGKTEFENSAKSLLEAKNGPRRVEKDPLPTNKSKLVKYESFSSAAQLGLVCIVENSFANKATLEAFYRENELFDGERSTAHRKDDWADCVATGFNLLRKKKVNKIVLRNQNSSPTAAAAVLGTMQDIKLENLSKAS